MHYYGYEWEEQVSKLVSRITLHLQKEVELRFCSTARVTSKGEEEYLYGLTLPQRFDIEKSVLADMVKDLKCIHVNKRYWHYENAFIVCREPEILEAWYKLHYDGAVATRLHKILGDRAYEMGYGEGFRAMNHYIKSNMSEGEYDELQDEVEQDMLAKGILVKHVVDKEEVCNE